MQWSGLRFTIYKKPSTVTDGFGRGSDNRGYATTALRLEPEVIGDNSYYLGFLFTLTSLAVTLYFVVEAGADKRAELIPEVISGFGVALVSTIVGVFIRVLMMQFRLDLVARERETRIELDDVARRLRVELAQSVERVKAFTVESFQHSAERESEFRRSTEVLVKGSQSMLADLARTLQEETSRSVRETDDSTIEHIAGRLQTAARQQGALVTLLDDRLGAVIREAGGSIDAEGTITLPQAILFDSNNDKIKDPAFLRKLCVPWLETLRQSGMNIADLKIEGHASSEWAVDATKEQAYLNNLDLSQRRARNALTLCLSEVKDPDALAWVREHLAAVGYSSARLIYGPDGTEDHDASRRVMFSVGLNQEGLIDDIRRDVTTTDALMNATGPARVIDGDTVEVKETSFRLSGIDAPEMGQQCRNKAGIYFDCGEVARRGLEQAIAGQPIECNATELDMYKRPIATCMVGGQDLAEVMILKGYAVAFSRYSQTYVARAETAQQANVGIWKTDFQMPWEYRKDN